MVSTAVISTDPLLNNVYGVQMTTQPRPLTGQLPRPWTLLLHCNLICFVKLKNLTCCCRMNKYSDGCWKLENVFSYSDRCMCEYLCSRITQDTWTCSLSSKRWRVWMMVWRCRSSNGRWHLLKESHSLTPACVLHHDKCFSPSGLITVISRLMLIQLMENPDFHPTHHLLDLIYVVQPPPPNPPHPSVSGLSSVWSFLERFPK